MKLLFVFVEVPQRRNCFGANLDFIKEEKCLAGGYLLRGIGFEFKEDSVDVKPAFKNPSLFWRFLEIYFDERLEGFGEMTNGK